MCRCIECDKPAVCGEKYCDNCFIDKLQTDTERNMYAGGRFYGGKLEPDTLASIQRGLSDAREGRVSKVDLDSL